MCEPVQDIACVRKPDRQFTREWQEYRKKSRGLEKQKPRRKRKYQVPAPLPAQPQTTKDSNGMVFLLG
jgi:hypothetical protein